MGIESRRNQNHLGFELINLGNDLFAEGALVILICGAGRHRAIECSAGAAAFP